MGDSAGRNSTPLHLAAGYNNLEVAEYLLEQGADVNAQDKGGLIPLHNASSYGHLDIAALLIKYSTIVNATDKWGFTPLHEAAQKGRTQLCALLLAHGSDPTLKNQEGQTPLDLASADDVKCLLQDAMPSGASVSAAAPTAVVPAGAGAAFPRPHPGDGSMDFTKTEMVTSETSLNMSIGAFLTSLGLEQLREVFDREHISVDILAEMGHEDLKQIGITAFGHRHKLIKGIEKLVSGNAPVLWQPPPSSSGQGTVLV